VLDDHASRPLYLFLSYLMGKRRLSCDDVGIYADIASAHQHLMVCSMVRDRRHERRSLAFADPKGLGG
jgi:hypothetical protein